MTSVFLNKVWNYTQVMFVPSGWSRWAYYHIRIRGEFIDFYFLRVFFLIFNLEIKILRVFYKNMFNMFQFNLLFCLQSCCFCFVDLYAHKSRLKKVYHVHLIFSSHTRIKYIFYRCHISVILIGTAKLNTLYRHIWEKHLSYS